MKHKRDSVAWLSGRASPSHGGGHRFKSCSDHQKHAGQMGTSSDLFSFPAQAHMLHARFSEDLHRRTKTPRRSSDAFQGATPLSSPRRPPKIIVPSLRPAARSSVSPRGGSRASCPARRDAALCRRKRWRAAQPRRADLLDRDEQVHVVMAARLDPGARLQATGELGVLGEKAQSNQQSDRSNSR